MSKSKAIVAGSEKAFAELQGEKAFNPRPAPMINDEQMFAYLKRWKVSIGEGIKVTLAPVGINFKEAPAEVGVYFPILAMSSGAHLPLPNFARNVLTFYKLAPTQLKIGSWRVILGFEKLCQLCKLDYGLEEFRSLYGLSTNKDGSCFFMPRKGKLISEISDCDSGWKDMIAFVTGLSETTDPKDQALVLREWVPKGRLIFHRTTHNVSYYSPYI